MGASNGGMSGGKAIGGGTVGGAVGSMTLELPGSVGKSFDGGTRLVG